MTSAARPTHRLERSQMLYRPVEDVFAFYSDAANLEAITPPFLRFRVLTPMPIEMRAGTRIDYALSLHGVPIRWRTLITRWEPGVCFVDEQEAGPYAQWRHTHRFEPRGHATVMHDTVEYREPFGPIGQLAHALFVRRMLDRIFDFRRDATNLLLARSRAAASASGAMRTRAAKGACA
jgi:ligand-binding SRPBCC domain-containing protein